MKKIWVHKARSFEEAERFERNYYRAISAKERVETVDWLRQVVARKIREIGRYGKTRATFIGRNELIRNKELSGRRQDQVDLDRLRPKRPRGNTRKSG